MTRLHRAALVVLAAGLAACGTGSPTEPALQVSAIRDGTLPPGPFDPAEIHDAWVEGDLLHLRVSYGGGCRKHDFALRFSRLFLHSDPPQALLYLAHDANADPCRAIVGDHLVFDLRPLKRVYLGGKRGGHGTVDLRLYAPGEAESFPSLIRYVF